MNNVFLLLTIKFPQEKIGLLLGTGGKTFKRIGSLFKVHIHLTSGHHQSGEWVSIYGKEEDRGRAKVQYWFKSKILSSTLNVFWLNRDIFDDFASRLFFFALLICHPLWWTLKYPEPTNQVLKTRRA